uniref:IlvB acetolactate synthase n=1 Tax=uncultured delta proteobacterium DeepAnt-32C6 TaxID=357895 RepID=Q2I6K8_9DELT|nr:IlvB acetolactate synthase [uncultured delta proteobacterium DeepAnt-32C6]
MARPSYSRPSSTPAWRMCRNSGWHTRQETSSRKKLVLASSVPISPNGHAESIKEIGRNRQNLKHIVITSIFRGGQNWRGVSHPLNSVDEPRDRLVAVVGRKGAAAMTGPTRGQTMVDVFLGYLRREGARVVFGVPGGLLHPFFQAVERDEELQLVITKHEEGAAFMADGFARTARGLAVCAGTAGPGSTNLLTGVSVAYADGVPLLVVTGQAPSHALGKGAAQETAAEDIDIVSMFKPITKYSAMVISPETMPHHLRRALRRALSGRPGPVHLNIPVDFWNVPITDHQFAPGRYRPTTSAFDRKAVKKASKALMEARRPAILIGSGVAIAGAERIYQDLSELLAARVATTPRAKGVFPEDHPHSLGVLGFAGHQAARSVMLGDTVDVLLTVGASLNETATFNWNRALQPSECLIQIDIDADRVGRNYPVDIALVGDAKTVGVELMFALWRHLEQGAAPQSRWRHEPVGTQESTRYLNAELRVSDAVPLTPQRWRADLQQVLPADAIVFSDIGGHMLFNIQHLCIGREQRFMLNLGFGSMGHGTSAAVGAALAAPERPVVSIIGDACFTMNGMELLTAREYGVPVVWIVENNQMHGITWHGSRLVEKGAGMESVVYKRPVDIAAIAKAMGLAAWVVTKPGEIMEIFPEALTRGPSLIEVLVDPEIAPPIGDRANTIAGFKR